MNDRSLLKVWMDRRISAPIDFVLKISREAGAEPSRSGPSQGFTFARLVWVQLFVSVLPKGRNWEGDPIPAAAAERLERAYSDTVESQPALRPLSAPVWEFHRWAYGETGDFSFVQNELLCRQLFLRYVGGRGAGAPDSLSVSVALEIWREYRKRAELLLQVVGSAAPDPYYGYLFCLAAFFVPSSGGADSLQKDSLDKGNQVFYLVVSPSQAKVFEQFLRATSSPHAHVHVELMRPHGEVIAPQVIVSAESSSPSDALWATPLTCFTSAHAHDRALAQLLLYARDPRVFLTLKNALLHWVLLDEATFRQRSCRSASASPYSPHSSSPPPNPLELTWNSLGPTRQQRVAKLNGIQARWHFVMRAFAPKLGFGASAHSVEQEALKDYREAFTRSMVELENSPQAIEPEGEDCEKDVAGVEDAEGQGMLSPSIPISRNEVQKILGGEPSPSVACGGITPQEWERFWSPREGWLSGTNTLAQLDALFAAEPEEKKSEKLLQKLREMALTELEVYLLVTRHFQFFADFETTIEPGYLSRNPQTIWSRGIDRRTIKEFYYLDEGSSRGFSSRISHIIQRMKSAATLAVLRAKTVTGVQDSCDQAFRFLREVKDSRDKLEGPEALPFLVPEQKPTSGTSFRSAIQLAAEVVAGASTGADCLVGLPQGNPYTRAFWDSQKARVREEQDESCLRERSRGFFTAATRTAASYTFLLVGKKHKRKMLPLSRLAASAQAVPEATHTLIKSALDPLHLLNLLEKEPLESRLATNAEMGTNLFLYMVVLLVPLFSEPEVVGDLQIRSVDDASRAADNLISHFGPIYNNVVSFRKSNSEEDWWIRA